MQYSAVVGALRDIQRFQQDICAILPFQPHKLRQPFFQGGVPQALSFSENFDYCIQAAHLILQIYHFFLNKDMPAYSRSFLLY